MGTPFPSVVMPTDSNVLYYSFITNVASVPTGTPSDVFRGLAGGAFNTAVRLQIRNAAGGFNIGSSKNGGSNIYTSAVYPLHTAHLVVIKYTVNRLLQQMM